MDDTSPRKASNFGPRRTLSGAKDEPKNANTISFGDGDLPRRVVVGRSGQVGQSYAELAESTITIRDLRPSEVIAGRFRIVRFIDRGGMGEVFLNPSRS